MDFLPGARSHGLKPKFRGLKLAIFTAVVVTQAQARCCLLLKVEPLLNAFFHWLRARRERNHTPVEKNNNKHAFMIILYGSG
jgi:hypothetical protein